MKRPIRITLVLALWATCVLASDGGTKPSRKPAPPPAPKAAATASAPRIVSNVRVDLDAAGAQPRELEDTTEKAIVRDYGTAWTVLAQALAENRSDLVPAGFIGYAQQKLAEQIKQQKRSGLRTRYVDHGHKVQALFYSNEGSAMQLRDVASFGIQLLDGDRVVSEQNVTLNYLAVMTVAEDRWKVRVLQALPGETK